MSTPARYLKPEVYQALASQFVCGTLRGPARRRFVTLMQRHQEIAHAVASWEKQMDGLNDTRDAVQTSPALWDNLEKQLFSESRPVPKGSPLQAIFGRWWLGLSGFAMSCVLAVALTFQVLETPERVNYVAVMEAEDGQAQWVATSSKLTRKLRIERVGDPMEVSANMVIWAVSKEDGSVYRFGEVQAKERNWISLNDEAWDRIKTAQSLFVTAEVTADSVSPSAQVLATGLCVQLNYDPPKSV